MIYGDTLRTARRGLNWTQARVAAEVHTDPASVSRMELGLYDRTLSVLRDALRVRVAESVAAGQLDTRASEALGRVQALEFGDAALRPAA